MCSQSTLRPVKNKFTDEDFTAFLLFAGTPPSYDIPGTDYPSLAYRPYYVEWCNQFIDEYFNPNWPDADWLSFYKEFLEWLHCQGEIK